MMKVILSFSVLLCVWFPAKAQTATYSTLNFPNNYVNTITTGLYSGNFRSGFIYQSSGSINFGLTGLKTTNFRFRWLAHDNGAIDYETDTDQVMLLDGYGNLNLKGSLTTNGNVGIGTTDTKGYKLAVNGDAIFTRIKVKAYTTWPDFVFAPDYDLPALSEVDAFIKQHKHLPDMPSEKEVNEQGQDLGEMNKKLLQKVEELTLYILKQDAQLKRHEQEILQLKSSIEKR